VADRIAILFEGKIVAVGTPDEVRGNPDPAIQKFLTIEFNKAK
jgi:ABC-type transporter Mla maintaining outer membrane lipid asymmetry ATPase subunit MlaF